jgi:hypothetical protein
VRRAPLLNGRVEDSIIGRFMSADPHIPDPTNAQDYNRYSYVDNNPLTLIDPSGFDDAPAPNYGGAAEVAVPAIHIELAGDDRAGFLVAVVEGLSKSRA